MKKEEVLVEVELDKASIDVYFSQEGYLAIILVRAGEEAPVGSVIGSMTETKAEIEKAIKLSKKFCVC